ncbi:MAG: hypothetical protein ACP5P3_08065 [Ignavibacteria bacterium]
MLRFWLEKINWIAVVIKVVNRVRTEHRFSPVVGVMSEFRTATGCVTFYREDK